MVYRTEKYQKPPFFHHINNSKGQAEFDREEKCSASEGQENHNTERIEDLRHSTKEPDTQLGHKRPGADSIAPRIPPGLVISL